MRRVAPVWWNEQPDGVGGFGDGGYWVVTKHKDVKEVSRRSDVFSSLEKTALPRYKDGTVQAQIDTGKFVLLNMDAPAPHPSAQDRVACLHTARGGATACRSGRTGPPDRGRGRRRGQGRLRRAGVL